MYFEAHQERERLVDRHEADWPAQRGKRDEADLRQSASAIDLRGVEQVFGNTPYRRGKDDHPQRCADKAVGDDDQRDRRPSHRIERFCQTKHLHQELV